MEQTSDSTFYLPLSGVESEHCALIVNKSLDSVQGITAHKVELNNQRAVIETNDALDTIPQAVTAIRSYGYDVETVTKTFAIANMSCASCAVSVESMLSAQPGVLKAVVNYANSTAQVEFIPGITAPLKLRQAIQSIGYDLLIDEAKSTHDTVTEIQDNKLKSLRKKTVAAAIFSLPVVLIGMFFMDIPYANYIMWALSSPVIIVFGRQFFVGAWKQAKHRSANMDTLVALSTGIAYVFSVFNTVFPDFWHRRGLHAHVYFEASAVVIAFILLGKLLEERAKSSTSSAIKKLIGLQPQTVTVVDSAGNPSEVPISQVVVGDILQVKPGEKIAVDGKVTENSSFVDESMISGEAIPVFKEKGAAVFAGTINQKGSFLFMAEKVGSDTLLAHIIKRVQDAQGSKAPVQKLVDKIAGIFVPIVIGIAVLSLVLWVFLGGTNGVTQGLISLVTVLVIACPCALGLATPTAIMVGVGKGAENRILIKDAESLETAQNINAIILDKTGTITEGKPRLTEILWATNIDQAKFSLILLGIEQQSEHPLAQAVVSYYRSNNFSSLGITNFESITGKGVSAMYDGQQYFVGTKAFLQQQGVGISKEMTDAAESWERQASTVIWFSDNKDVLAVMALSDNVKPSSAKAIQQLYRMGIDVYMLTGDSTSVAEAIANKVGIRKFKAKTLPSDKSEFVKKLQSEGKIVAMVGDGINDSEALAQADVSIAMGKGSDIAMDVAKMTLISSDLMHIPQAIRLSKRTVRLIRQNLFWAFIYNLIGIPIAAGIFYPINGFVLNPMIAGAAMALSSVSVVTNSLRLKWATL